VKVRAAVAWKEKTPLAIEEVDLEGPKAGEALVKIVATGVKSGPSDFFELPICAFCHRDRWIW